MCTEVYRRINLNGEIVSVEEEILTRKHAFIPISEIKGPSTELFFHELENRNISFESRKDKFIGVLLTFLYLTTLPVVYLLLKLDGVSDILQKNKINGLNGRIIEIRHYNVGVKQSDKPIAKNHSRIQKVLFQTGLYKLPMSIHLIKGELSFRGPEPLCEKTAKQFMEKFTDFYKRYAVRPGVVNPSTYFNNEAEKSFKEELKFILSKTAR